MSCPSITDIVIDTDSPAIRESAAAHFPEVAVIDRPLQLRGGHVSMNQILLHDIDVVKADIYIQTHSTNPLLRAASIESALRAFGASVDTHDSLFTVTPLYARLWNEDATPINHEPEKLIRTQDLKPVMEENSCLYIFPGDLLRETGARIGRRPMLFPLAPYEAWDIDEELDWLIVEALEARSRLVP